MQDSAKPSCGQKEYRQGVILHYSCIACEIYYSTKCIPYTLAWVGEWWTGVWGPALRSPLPCTQLPQATLLPIRYMPASPVSQRAHQRCPIALLQRLVAPRVIPVVVRVEDVRQLPLPGRGMRVWTW